jgi:glycosyltransferase involved in cell wall biosynthesis
MKILINCPLPFALAHGGQQVQVQRTMAALSANGVEVEAVRWWDENQNAGLIHYFGRMPAEQIRLAHQKKIKVVIGELLTATGSRSPAQLHLQKIISRTVHRLAPRSFTAAFNWQSYQLADAVIANTPAEAHLMRYLFDAPKDRLHLVPNGVEEIFLDSQPVARGQTPLWIIGKAYSDADAYAQKFFSLARQHPQIIRYEGAVADRARLAQIYREARGFVLLSTMETRSLSAEEAAACECPLLLSDLPWARSTFENAATYCPLTKSIEATAGVLRKFYDAAPSLPAPPKPPTWNEIGRQLKTIYERVLSTSR